MNVSSLLPHRAPMLLIDEIIEWDLESKTLVAAKNIGENEFFLQGHYPDFPIVPGVITCEMIFQAGAALISLLLQNQSIKGSIDSIKGKVPVVTRCNQIKFREMIRPNDTVLLSVALTDKVGSAFYLKGKASVAGKTSASLEFTCLLAEPQP